MNDTQLAAKVREIVARRFGRAVETVLPETSFFTLAKDSLDIVELVLALETEFQVKIEDNDLEKIGKLCDLTNYLREKRLVARLNNPDLAAGVTE